MQLLLRKPSLILTETLIKVPRTNQMQNKYLTASQHTLQVPVSSSGTLPLTLILHPHQVSATSHVKHQNQDEVVQVESVTQRQYSLLTTHPRKT
jgi:hypothetical protein